MLADVGSAADEAYSPGLLKKIAEVADLDASLASHFLDSPDTRGGGGQPTLAANTPARNTAHGRDQHTDRLALLRRHTARRDHA